MRPLLAGSSYRQPQLSLLYHLVIDNTSCVSIADSTLDSACRQITHLNELSSLQTIASMHHASEGREQHSCHRSHALFLHQIPHEPLQSLYSQIRSLVRSHTMVLLPAWKQQCIGNNLIDPPTMTRLYQQHLNPLPNRKPLRVKLSSHLLSSSRRSEICPLHTIWIRSVFTTSSVIL